MRLFLDTINKCQFLNDSGLLADYAVEVQEDHPYFIGFDETKYYLGWVVGEVPVLKIFTEKELAAFAEVEKMQAAKSFVSSEMIVADVEINKHVDKHVRIVATIDEWVSYRNDLRDYVKSGVIAEDKPVRPV